MRGLTRAGDGAELANSRFQEVAHARGELDMGGDDGAAVEVVRDAFTHSEGGQADGRGAPVDAATHGLAPFGDVDTDLGAGRLRRLVVDDRKFAFGRLRKGA